MVRIFREKKKKLNSLVACSPPSGLFVRGFGSGRRRGASHLPAGVIGGCPWRRGPHLASAAADLWVAAVSGNAAGGGCVRRCGWHRQVSLANGGWLCPWNCWFCGSHLVLVPNLVNLNCMGVLLRPQR
ncbi:hypothetical protein BRADI_5g02834v3 [Brachypodium distachyon]|uniref:Uncharacterized protein n=1 Tax=Brachypodium distachyon TaxID=15368 RepID=A0A0Q3H147_BRADI|nr:hypothetical protein BRADI_5g02834v3 [Brachypodium distachyon]